MDNLNNSPLITIGNFSVSLFSLIGLALLLVFTWLILMFFKRIINRSSRFDDGQRFAIYTLTKYFVYVFLISAGLKLLGIDISVLIAGSAAFFVGIGLGLQGLFYDFISGIILLVDGTIKVGHVIQIQEKRVEILAIRFRTSVVKTRDEKEIIIPNSYFTKNEIINWTHQRNITRHEIEISLAIKDIERGMEIIRSSVGKHERVAAIPEPYVRIESFGEYAAQLKLLFWSEEVYAVGRMKGEVRLMILNALREEAISFPFPQRVVTVNQPKES